MALDITISEIGSSRAVVWVRGDVDMFNASKLRVPLEELSDRGCRHIVLDLSRARHFDSSGMGAILGAYCKISGLGGRLSVAGASPTLRSLFEITRFHEFLPLYRTVDEALQPAELEESGIA